MEDNKTYFGEIGHGLKTLAIGMKTTWGAVPREPQDDTSCGKAPSWTPDIQA